MADTEDDLLRDDQARQAEIAKQIHIHRRLAEVGAFSLFVPSSFQKPWFQTEKKVTTLIKGNQVGGTTCLIIRMLASCLGTYPLSMGGIVPPDWSQIRIRERPGMYLLMGKNFTKTIPEVILPKLREFIAPNMLSKKPRKNQMGVPYIFYFKSGAELHLASYDQDADAFEGSLWNGVAFDEPPTREIYMACRRGTMRTRGWIFFCMTPLKNMWVYDEIHMPAQEGKLPDVAAFEIHSHANCTTCAPGEGHIDHNELNNFFAGLSPAERRAREMGLPLDYSNVRYAFVTRETHVCENLW
jgi:phage terminase large subunit-like protein